MKKVIFIITAFFLLTAFTAVNVWKNDDPHSQLGFTVTHLGIADVSGTFNDFDVNVTSSKPDFSDAVFELTAKVASVDTRVEARDNHLKSAIFLMRINSRHFISKARPLRKQERIRTSLPVT